MTELTDMKVVVVGAGIIGASTAYHFAERGVRCTIIERCGVACASSGKAGGFLAYDWCDRNEVGQLARTSFVMHEKLAGELDHDVDYRKLDTYSVMLVGGKSGGRIGKNIKLDWLDGNVKVSRVGRLGDTKTTAQVHPRKLTEAFIEAAKKKCGTEVIYRTVTGVRMDGRAVKAVKTKDVDDGSESEITCTHLILAMGPWSTECCKWFQRIPPVIPEKAASIVVRGNVGPQALFTSFTTTDGESSEPEVYPRPDGTVYICSLAKSQPLPDNPGEIEPHETDTRRLKDFAQTISKEFEKDDCFETEQACYLPCSPDGLPVIGTVPDTEGVVIATGHSCWGILNSPATGRAVVELVLDGKSSTVDLSPFSPRRFAHAFK